MPDCKEAPSTIYVVDDDRMMRDALDSLLRSFSYRVRSFTSTGEFRLHRRDPGPACLILDVRMPEEDGLTFQKKLASGDDALPIIFLTGHGDVPMAVQAMRHGAIEFLLKPFKAEDLAEAVRLALAQQKRCSDAVVLASEERKRFASLTLRERKIIDGIVAGKLSKQIAAELGLKEITIKVGRAQIMSKLEVGSVAALVALVHRLAAARQFRAFVAQTGS